MLQVFTQITLVLLLWGTMCGGLALISDVAVIMVEKGFAGEGDVPAWLNGRTCMTAVTLLVLYPLCLQRHMREVRKGGRVRAVCIVEHSGQLVVIEGLGWAGTCLPG